MVKNLYWVGRSREIVRGFMRSVRSAVGYQLFRIQQGMMPTDYKPLSIVGKGVYEIRLHRPHEHRVVYVAKLGMGIFVLHAFEKKTQKMLKKEIGIAQKNYQEVVNRVKGVHYETGK